jgi:alcohol-forming fatty acyl-CoA reductase
MGASDLSGQTVLLTGVTGFLGTAILEKLLYGIPGCRVLTLIRPGRQGVRRRLDDEVLATPAFTRLRERHGDGFAAEVASRVVPIAGDLGKPGLALDEEARRLVGAVGVVIHSAAEVSFDSALDVALGTNLGGPVRLVETVKAAGARPSVVQVSTAYVSGMRRGVVFEGMPGGLASAGGAALDWRSELRAAEAARARIEAESRTPPRMRRFGAAARRGIGASGIPGAGAESERLRARWVDEQLVASGRHHARALGWSDVYTMSKALAELAVAEGCADLSLSIVRPSIIESSLTEPMPSWITGLRMAEPIILAYGRGLLADFPGLPDGVIDLVPVDTVCNAVISAAAAPPVAGTPVVYHVSTGARNPLRFRGLFENVREYFRAHPLHDAAGAPIPVPDWEFPSGRREERRLARLERGLEAAVAIVESGPATHRTRALAERLEDTRDRVRRGRGLAEMYAVYTEMDAVFDDSNTRALDTARPATERAQFPFDIAGIDWSQYLQISHIPAVIELARLRRRPPRPVLPRPTQLRTEVPAGRLPAIRSTERALAVFDVEGTIADLTVVQHYLYFLLDREERRRWPMVIARTASRVPGWLRLDRANRLDFQRHFYRGYHGFEQEQIAAVARRAFHEITLPRCFPRGLRRVREHVDAGHRVVIVTGALEEIVRPLAELLDVELRAARLRTVDGVFDGDLADTPPSAEARGALVRSLAAEAGLELAMSYAYADSISDLSMLEVVGRPVPVNPDLRLAAVARRRGWPVQRWTVRDGGGRLPFVLPAEVSDSGARVGPVVAGREP